MRLKPGISVNYIQYFLWVLVTSWIPYVVSVEDDHDDHDHPDPDIDDPGHDHEDDDDDAHSSSNLIGHKIGALILLIVSGVVGAGLPYFFSKSKRFGKWLRWFQCLATGLFIGLALFHLLSEAILMTEEGGVGFYIGDSFLNMAYLFIVIGFVLLYYLEHIIWIPNVTESDRLLVGHHELTHSEKSQAETREAESRAASVVPDPMFENGVQISAEEQAEGNLETPAQKRKQNSELTASAVVLLLALSVHSVFEGSVIGVAQSSLLVWVSAVSIAGHKWAEGFVLACGLMRAKVSLWGSILILTVFVSASPMGLAIGWPLARLGSAAVGIASALAMGTLLYVGLDTLYGLHMKQRTPLIRHLEFLGVLLGIGILFGLWVVHLTAHIH